MFGEYLPDNPAFRDTIKKPTSTFNDRKRFFMPKIISKAFTFRIGGLLLACLLAFAAPASAQDDTPPGLRDPADLAARFLDYQPSPEVPPLTPLYEAGDTMQFWVGKTTSPTPVQITATLAAATPEIYLWVEQGIDYQGVNLQALAGNLNALLHGIRFRPSYTETSNLPGQAAQVYDPNNTLSYPDVDNDPHLYILYTTDLPEDRDAVYNPNNSLPPDLAPGGYSNQHEMLMINTTPYIAARLDDPVFVGTLLRGFYSYFADYNNPDLPSWLREALGWVLLYQFNQQTLTSQEVGAFLASPDTPLTRPSVLTNRTQTFGAQQLFLTYVSQRYGLPVLYSLFTGTGENLAPLDTALAAHNVVDPISGGVVTGADAFADFAVTNGVNTLFGDGRYFHRLIRLDPGLVATATTTDDLRDYTLEDQPVNQFGTAYVRLQSRRQATVTVNFEGETTVPRLNMPTDTPAENQFYWSGSERDRSYTLSRAFDLRDVDAATLTFDTWYDLADGWNYGYAEISADGGQTWDALPTENSSPNNRNGVAYGPGYTNISNPAQPRPFPVMGVTIGGDGMTISQIAPDGAAATSGLQPDDKIIGYDEQLWPGPPDLLGLLSSYSPGDTLNLFIQRGAEQMSVPVVLGAHPTRVIQPEPLWLTQHADLTPYAGQEVVIRFEYVSMPGHADRGFAVDNIAIPELSYSDDAEADSDWTLEGWQRVDNQLPQQFIVQAVTTGTQDRSPSARQLISPEDDATSGEWTFSVAQDEDLLIAVSGITDGTTLPGHFNLHVTSAT
jgi:hypothetical protein